MMRNIFWRDKNWECLLVSIWYHGFDRGERRDKYKVSSKVRKCDIDIKNLFLFRSYLFLFFIQEDSGKCTGLVLFCGQSRESMGDIIYQDHWLSIYFYHRNSVQFRFGPSSSVEARGQYTLKENRVQKEDRREACLFIHSSQ